MVCSARCEWLAITLALCVGQAYGALSGECRTVREWVRASLLDESEPSPVIKPGLDVVRQDHGEPRFDRSVLDTPLRIGDVAFAHGIGTHATSKIVVRLPAPGKEFTVQVGVDNNHDTDGKHGSVVFVVEVAGREAFRSETLRGGTAPVPVRLKLNGASEFVLRVRDAGDGQSWDQADWAAARVVLEDGGEVPLNKLGWSTAGAVGMVTAIPFSFVYGAKGSEEVLRTWTRSHEKKQAADGQERHVVTYADPESGLEVGCDFVVFDKYPAVEWVLNIRNTGVSDTPILKNIRPLDLRNRRPPSEKVLLHYAHGSTCAATDFLPLMQPVEAGRDIRLAPNGGRSSDGRLPFFNMEWQGGGMAGAIGWSGQWELGLTRSGAGAVRVQVGQQLTHLKLHPGESMRTPRILLVMWDGADRLRGHNLLRRVILDHYTPTRDGAVVTPPMTQNTWFTFNTGNDVTEENQLDAIHRIAPLGIEAYWLDAGWFVGGWPSGVGTWDAKVSAFPNGLRPLGDEAHKLGMKFVLWFEPERVHPESDIGQTHPEFVLRHGGGDGLFNLGDPKARKWLTDYLSSRIEKWGVDIYRNDFNIDPLRFWRAADAPDRQGMTENRYIAGLYQMWDDLLARNPGLAIDNCASGGRRIDFEISSRSYPLWKSDTQCCGEAKPVQDQVQTAGLSLYLPLHSAGCWGFDPYTFRSVALMGMNLCPDVRSDAFPAKLSAAAISEAKSLRPYYLGDYYPLTDITLDGRHWIGWQFDRPERGGGFAVCFRRAESPYRTLEVELRGLDPDAMYDVTFAETYQPGASRRMAGAELAELRIEIASAPGSVLVRYRRVE